MKRIPLTQGKFAIVDDELYEWLNQWKWFAQKDKYTYYAGRNVGKWPNQKMIFMHRQILGLKYKDGKQTDHSNSNGLDNRQSNIRICTIAQNNQNRRCWKNVKLKGVRWYKDIQKWRSRICYKGKFIHLGYFKNEIDAAKAYDKKAKELFGEFVHTNF